MRLKYRLKKDAIESYIVNSNFYLSDVAKMCGISRGYLYQLLGGRNIGAVVREKILSIMQKRHSQCKFEDVFEQIK